MATESNERPRLGDVVDAWCPRCRLNLSASVAALHADGRIAKVECRTCHNFHAYRPPKDLEAERRRKLKRLAAQRGGRSRSHSGSPQTATGGAARAASGGDDVTRQRWDELTADVKPWQARPWRADRAVQVGQFVAHKHHGLGYVEGVSPDGRFAIVLFREGHVRLEMSPPSDDS